MSINVSRGMADRGFLALLHGAALIAVVGGGMGSLGLMFYSGRHNNSWLLLGMFALWVLSPFVVLVYANAVSKDWAVLTRATLYCMMLVLTLGSLAIYGDVALGRTRTKTAFFFLVVPPASWLLIAIAVPIAAFVSGKRSRRRDGV